jgi:hypothetical protein
VQLLQHIGKTRKLYKLQELVSTYGNKFDAVHASAALVRLPKVAYRHGTASADDLSDETKKKVVALLQKLSGHMVGMRDRMYARQVANALWACGKLAQLSPGEHLLLTLLLLAGRLGRQCCADGCVDSAAVCTALSEAPDGLCAACCALSAVGGGPRCCWRAQGAGHSQQRTAACCGTCGHGGSGQVAFSSSH